LKFRAIIIACGWEDYLWDQLYAWSQMTETPFDDKIIDWLKEKWDEI
jgi:hypothetical protein